VLGSDVKRGAKIDAKVVKSLKGDNIKIEDKNEYQKKNALESDDVLQQTIYIKLFFVISILNCQYYINIDLPVD
jgi:hypothetical protein